MGCPVSSHGMTQSEVYSSAACVEDQPLTVALMRGRELYSHPATWHGARFTLTTWREDDNPRRS